MIRLSSTFSSLSPALIRISPPSSTIGVSSFCCRPKITISVRRVRETWTSGGPSESTRYRANGSSGRLRRRQDEAISIAIESPEWSSSSAGLGTFSTRDSAQVRVGRVERPQGVERAVADLDVGLVHQLPELHVRRRLVQRGQGRQGVDPELGLVDHGLAQHVDPGRVVQVGQRLGGEEPDLVTGALQALLERVDRRGAEPLELQRGQAGRLGVEQLLAPGGLPARPQLGAVDHGQGLDHPEVAELVLVVQLGDAEHQVAGGLAGRHPLLVPVLDLVEPLVDHRLEHLGRVVALARSP